MASRLPSPKCRARARGSAPAPPPPNSWGSAVFGATSSLTRRGSLSRLQPHFFLIFFFFKKNTPTPLLLTAAGPSPAPLSGAAHPSGCRLRTRAQPWAKQSRKTCRRGFSSLHQPPSLGNTNRPPGPVLSLGKFLRCSAPSWIWNCTGAASGIRSVLNPVERVAGARKSRSVGVRVALAARTREFAGRIASDLSSPHLVDSVSAGGCEGDKLR